MRRRRFLAALPTVAAASLAGCPGDSGADGPAETQPPNLRETPTSSRTPNTVERTRTGGTETSPTPTPSDGDDHALAMGETFETSDGRELTVSDPAVYRLVLAPERVSHHLYHRVTAAPANRQYLTVTVWQRGFEVVSDEPGIESDGWPVSLPLAATVAGERFASGRTVVGTENRERTGTVGIPVSLVDAQSGAVVWERSDGPSPDWELPERVVADLASAPRFEVQSFDVPDEVTRGDLLEMTATVANTGEREGRFLAEFDVDRPLYDPRETTVSVPAGETVTHTVTRLPEYVEGTDPLPVVLDWGSDRREATVEVRDRPTDTRSE
jgi:hypothetical protein